MTVTARHEVADGKVVRSQPASLLAGWEPE
jgi:hypothetical protein